MISISKTEHLPSFWNRGPGELGNGLLTLANTSLLSEFCFWNVMFVCLLSLKWQKWQNSDKNGKLVTLTSFARHAIATGMKYQKRVNEHEIPFGMFQPRKRAYLSRFSTFSGNFPVGRTDQTFSIYCRTEISGNFEWKAPCTDLWWQCGGESDGSCSSHVLEGGDGCGTDGAFT